uniref:Uncharacterized protein n=1 Tax=Arundo donax TaxID=35708 RepID=A0A0A9HF60_ARUDO
MRSKRFNEQPEKVQMSSFGANVFPTKAGFNHGTGLKDN